MEQIVDGLRPDEAVQRFLDGRLDLLIDGTFQEATSGKRFDVIDPATGATIATVAEADVADVDLAVQAARRALETGSWSKMEPAERTMLLHRLADLMEQHAAEFAQIEALDSGKPVSVAGAADVPRIYRHVPPHGGRGHEANQHDDPAVSAGKLSRVHRSRAGRRRRADRTVELPAVACGVEDRPGTRCGLHRHPGIGRADAALRNPPRPACSRGRLSARRRKHPRGLRRARGYRTRQPSRRR